jgi:hypothetical protein
MPLVESQPLLNMQNAWEKTAASFTALPNIADAVRHTTIAVAAVAHDVDAFDGRIHTNHVDIEALHHRIGALEQRIGNNIQANIKTRSQRASAWGVMLAGFAGIIVFPASIYASAQTCPSGTNFSAVGCGMSATACVGGLVSIASAIAGCCAIGLPNDP